MEESLCRWGGRAGVRGDWLVEREQEKLNESGEGWRICLTKL